MITWELMKHSLCQYIRKVILFCHVLRGGFAYKQTGLRLYFRKKGNTTVASAAQTDISLIVEDT